MFLHILGSDIAHHNRTLLDFFAQQLVPKLAEKPRFFIVGSADRYADFAELDLTFFATKKALAKAVIQRASSEPMLRFFLHGQYNGWLWLAILCGKLPPARCVWHIWGADLYENATSLAFRLFYPLRRLAQKRLTTVYGTVGDLDHFRKLNARSHRSLLYFPTKMPTQFPEAKAEISPRLTVLLGNSGDLSNRHLQGLRALKQLAEPMRINVPMGYPQRNQPYIQQVMAQAQQYFAKGEVHIWEEQFTFDDYLTRLAECDLGYFPTERQQGIGTLCLLIYLNVPVALSRKNPFCLDLIAQHIPFLYLDEISRSRLIETKRQLQALDKRNIAFFAPNYYQQWREIVCL